MVTVTYGHVELLSRLRPEGARVVGEGRALHFDENGLLVKDTGWEPTGVVMHWE